METVDRQLKRGVLDILLLRLLEDGPRYGYELMSMLAERSGDYFATKEGTLYPVLYRLEDAGHIKSEWESAEPLRRGAQRKYYAITPEGRERLDAGKEELARFARAIRQTMEG